MEVTYLNHMGTDDTVVDAARVSFHKEALNFSAEQNGRLIKYLAEHNHIAPFMHCMITLREKVPIFVARQRFKHTVGFAYNEVSRRYVDEQPEFYTPDVWRKRAENKKQGSGEDLIRVKNAFWGFSSGGVFTNSERDGLYLEEYHNGCIAYYQSLLDNGVAPEQARMVLPQSMYTEYVVTGSLAAFARAYKLRSEENAQKEIQDLAVKWDEIIRPLFPRSWEALVG